MALMLDTWQQTAAFNPADPTQKKIETWAGIPGQRASFYFNRVPNQGRLMGVGDTPYRSGYALLGRLGTLPSSFSLRGLATYAVIGVAAWLAGTKTKTGRKVVRKVKGLLPGRK